MSVKNKRMKHLLVMIAVISFLIPAGFAEEKNKGSRDTLQAGAGILYSTTIYKGDDDSVYPIPFVYFVKGQFGIIGRKAFYRLYEKEQLSFDIIGVWDFRGYDDDDSPFLAGMHDRDMTINGGFELGYEDDWGFVRVSFVNDLLGKHDGQELILSYSKIFKRDKLRLTPSVGISYQTHDLTNYYYGVRSSEATAVRPMYEPDPAWNPFGALNATYRFNEKWSFTGSIKLDLLDKEIRHSPIVDQSYQLQFTAGIMYRF